jgi:hypothetical protein
MHTRANNRVIGSPVSGANTDYVRDVEFRRETERAGNERAIGGAAGYRDGILSGIDEPPTLPVRALVSCGVLVRAEYRRTRFRWT